MCGINGIYKFSGIDYEASIIQKMNDTMAHRGPNAEGVFQDQFIHLGHRRLSIIDTSDRANQPFLSNDERYVLVFNGEIYNYQAIKAKLPDYPFKTNSDTEVVIAAYMAWGKACVNEFNGMFAFAIWDKQDKSLFIARDRIGIKPLYYCLDQEQLIFSSSLKSILSTGLIKKKIDKNGLVDYLRFQTVHAPYTIIENVYSLLPGQYMFFNEEKEEIKTYWDPTTVPGIPKQNRTETIIQIQTKLNEAVDKRLMSDVPFGAFLSGGIDSSIIVALMAKQREEKIDTFSVVFKEDEFSEGKFAKEIAKKYKTNHHEIELEADYFKSLIPEALSFLDHPSGDGLNTYVVSKETKQAGVSMALSGLGGDELFGGYSIFNQIPNLQKNKWLGSFPNYARKQVGYVYDAIKRDVASGKIKELLKQEYFDTEYVYQYYRQVLMDNQISGLIKTNKLPLNRTFEIAHEHIGYQKSGWGLPALSRISVAEMRTYMSNVLLRDTDQMSMASALEVRVPFLDHEFVEYVLRIPDDIKSPSTPKKLLVDAFIDDLPESIYNRKKMGFVLPYEKWMKNELKSFCETNLNQLKNNPNFKANGIDNLWKRFLKNDKRVTWSRIWPLVILGHWMTINGIEG
ncbi:asparagine synthase (glutamine-hydrolyzing) [Putridiphycobacter roseus]|uniref:asparagine synthase (glutamine-hydrolyzing) n=1 Tax=Putridiphycobacter roseus TaxID=2219161 RepID=A0A2W1NDS7_9FLAO|nr:asparagine synthase (glutamine-hydrolyzing) [Putridiphycobacter roseus]PZE17263.1 asparagine synthase (glutamine-hydrolyzing) [Putridiphycobacter roseus]